MKRQQSAQETPREEDSEMSRHGSNRRSDEVLADEEAERADITRERGLDEDSDGESR